MAVRGDGRPSYYVRYSKLIPIFFLFLVVNSYFFPIFLGARIPIFLFFDHSYYLTPCRPQLSCGKVMFLHLSVSHSVHRGWGVVHAGIQHPQAGTPPPGQVQSRFDCIYLVNPSFPKSSPVGTSFTLRLFSAYSITHSFSSIYNKYNTLPLIVIIRRLNSTLLWVRSPQMVDSQ